MDTYCTFTFVNEVLSVTDSLPPGRSSPKAGFSILLLAIAAFVTVTNEYIVVGLLPELAQSTHTTIAQAGQLVTLFAIAMMFCGPVLAVMLSRVERKRLFVLLLFSFVISNALTAIANNYWVLAGGRILSALALSAFWGLASDTAAQLAGPERAGRAVSQFYFGVACALLFGLPLGTLLSHALGWRAVFWTLSLLSLVTTALFVFFLPRMDDMQTAPIRRQLGILKKPWFVANLLLSGMVYTTLFTVYTYLTDMIVHGGHIPSGQVGWWLMGFGGVGLVGNWVAGQLADRSLLRTTMLLMSIMALALATILPLASISIVLFGIMLGLWGTTHTGLLLISVVRVMKAGAKAQAFAGTLNVSAANAGTAFGAMIGGLVISQYGISRVGSFGAFLALFTVAITYGVIMLKRKEMGRT